MREIIPDRECCGIHEIRKEELIEHEDDPEWEECILMTEYIAIEP